MLGDGLDIFSLRYLKHCHFNFYTVGLDVSLAKSRVMPFNIEKGPVCQTKILTMKLM